MTAPSSGEFCHLSISTVLIGYVGYTKNPEIEKVLFNNIPKLKKKNVKLIIFMFQLPLKIIGFTTT